MAKQKTLIEGFWDRANKAMEGKNKAELARQIGCNNGKLVEVPEWANEKRCGNCIYWQRWSKDEQPPSGWGVKGTCGNYRGPGHYDTAQTSYCQEWHEKPAWE